MNRAILVSYVPLDTASLKQWVRVSLMTEIQSVSETPDLKKKLTTMDNAQK
jgi:hypothetical protein